MGTTIDPAIGISILALMLSIAGFFIAREETKKLSEAQNLLVLIDYLQRSSVRTARGVVLGSLDKKPYTEWGDEDKESASEVAASFDVAGILARKGTVDRRVIVDNWGSSIIRCYEICRPCIEEQRSRQLEQFQARYWDDFDWLYDEARAVILEGPSEGHNK